MTDYPFFVYLLVCAGVTYLIRMLPLVLIKKKVQNRFLLSFLSYIPYAVLAAMTIPACFYATGNIASAAVGVLAALIAAWFGGSLPVVALATCGGALLTDLFILYALPLF